MGLVKGVTVSIAGAFCLGMSFADTITTGDPSAATILDRPCFAVLDLIGMTRRIWFAAAGAKRAMTASPARPRTRHGFVAHTDTVFPETV